MITNAHDFYETELRATCTKAMRKIADNVDADTWWLLQNDDFGEGNDEDIQIEYESRDGFWSHNDGGCEIHFRGDWRRLYYKGCDNPHIKKRIESMHEELLENAKENKNYIAWLNSEEGKDELLRSKKAGCENDVVMHWIANTAKGNMFEDDYLDSECDYEPFIKSRFMVQDEHGYKCDDPIDENYHLTLHFHFSFNDDYGYGRDWCQGGYYGNAGFGNREKVCICLHFTPKDAEWVREQIMKIADKVAATDDSVECKNTENIYSPSLENAANGN